MKSKKKRFFEYLNSLKHRKIIIACVIFFIFIFIITFVLLGIRINFIINDELSVKLEPLDENIVSTYDKVTNISFEFVNDNSFVCKSECSYEFIDLSNNKVLDSDTLVLNSKTKVVRNYNLTPSNYGSGQDIYSFQVTCNNIKNFVCTTDGKERYKSSFVTLSYDLSEEERAKVLMINEELSAFLRILKNIDLKDQEIIYLFNKAYFILKDSLFFNNINSINIDISNINKSFNDLENNSKYMLELWDDNKYIILLNIINESNSNLYSTYDKVNSTEIKLYNLIDNYESLVYDLNSLSDRYLVIDSLIDYYNLSNDTLELQKATNFRDDFVSLNINLYNTSNDLISFKNEVNRLALGIYELTNITNINNLSLNYSYSLNLSKIDRNLNISFNSTISTDIKVKEPICCVFGNCKVCCTIDSCKDDPSLYPILFVHGHAFNKKTSPEVSLNSFTKIQNRLQEEGIINAGQIDLQNLEEIAPGEYGKSGNPISVRASYYYVHYFDLGKYVITTQKSERIENYALRLNEIINILKERTGSGKVNIVSHSMGGLVTREYVRIFGDSSVNKIILIGTPNNGVSGRTKDLCDFLGSKKECDDMTEGSIFLKRLNNSKVQKVKFYTIGASGCPINNEDGDGVVKLRSVPLPYATNYFVNGTCTDLFKSNLHDTILDPDKTPEVYNVIKRILKS